MNNHYSDVKIINLEPLRVASYVVRSMEPENESIIFLKQWTKDQGLDSAEGVREFGFDVCVSDEERAQGKRGYEYWISVPSQVEPSNGVVVKYFTGGRYALMQIRDPFADPFRLIPGGWETLWHWVNTNGHQFGDHQCLEEVLEDEQETYMNIYMAIK